MPPILEVCALHKTYGQVRAVDGVSFQVTDGEMFGLLGPNGAGKTTLLSIVAGLLSPGAGQVRLLGQEFHPDNKDLKKIIGVVPQDLAIYGELTARENLRFFGELYGIRGPKLDDQVAQVLGTIGLEEHAGVRAATFSGGMKRRLNLGAALVHGPRLLLLDEPTTGVDPQSRNHIFEEVRRLSAAGMTIIYTSHYMEEVAALCPRIGIIDHGRLIACDTLPNLLRRLPGVIRFQVSAFSASLRHKLEHLPQAHLRHQNGSICELECVDMKVSLLALVALLQEEKMELTSLETEEPNLERVFLHLTGRALRD
jgi:ABC-2 type transport system ATP-binding protein